MSQPAAFRPDPTPITSLGQNLQLRTMPMIDLAYLYARMPGIPDADPFVPLNVQALRPLTPDQVAQIDLHSPRQKRDVVEILRSGPRGPVHVAYARPTQRPGSLHGDLGAAVALLAALQDLLQRGDGPSEGAGLQDAGPLYGQVPVHLGLDLGDVVTDYRVRLFGDVGSGEPCWLIDGVDITGAGQVRWQIQLPDGPAVDW